MDHHVDMLLTTYFCRKEDPQRRGVMADPCDMAFAGLLDDCRRLNIYGIVFHDGVDQRFIDHCSGEFVDFVRIDSNEIDYHRLSCNDYRFFAYRKFLADSDLVSAIDTLWCVDLFDVRMNRSPGEFRRDHNDFTLFASVENDWIIGRGFISDERWMDKHLRRVYGEIPAHVDGRPILNAGVWGGEPTHVAAVIDRLCDEIDRLNPPCTTRPAKETYNCNMPAFQVVMHDTNLPPVWKGGAPFVSRFRMYETDAPVCFVHK